MTPLTQLRPPPTSSAPTLRVKLRTQTFRKGATHKLKPSPSDITTFGLSNSVVGPRDHYLTVPGASNISQNLILKAQAMPFGITFWYHSQKSTSSRFKVLSGSCLTAGGHAASFINQVCIILVSSFGYLMVSQMGWVRKHELVLSHASEHVI